MPAIPRATVRLRRAKSRRWNPLLSAPQLAGRQRSLSSGSELMLYRKRPMRVRTLAGETHEHRRTPRPRDCSRYRAVRPSNIVSFGRWCCHRAFTDLGVGRAVGLAGAMGIPNITGTRAVLLLQSLCRVRVTRGSDRGRQAPILPLGAAPTWYCAATRYGSLAE